jgi:hypothetical protein
MVGIWGIDMPNFTKKSIWGSFGGIHLIWPSRYAVFSKLHPQMPTKLIIKKLNGLKAEEYDP